MEQEVVSRSPSTMHVASPNPLKTRIEQKWKGEEDWLFCFGWDSHLLLCSDVIEPGTHSLLPSLLLLYSTSPQM